jgi:tRNA-splicing endonuclease subunit Sen54
MPTLREMDALFAQAPELPPPQPRKKNPLLNKLIKVSEATGAITDAKAVSQTSTTQPWTKRIQSFFGLSSTTPDRPLPRPNPFGVLKQGKKTIVVAVVDVGSVGFFRFGQGCFEEWPMA